MGRGQSTAGFSDKARRLGTLILLALALVASASPAPAQAHGGGTPQLVQAPAGAYEIYTWTNPDPARVGVLHVTVALVEPATQQPVLNAAVQVLAQPVDGGPEATAPATHDNAAIRTYYEADLELPAAGRWRITVAFDDAAGSGSASFELDVQPAAFNWRPVVIGATLAVIAVGAWFMMRPRTPRAGNDE